MHVKPENAGGRMKPVVALTGGYLFGAACVYGALLAFTGSASAAWRFSLIPLGFFAPVVLVFVLAASRGSGQEQGEVSKEQRSKDALIAAVTLLRAENSRSGSPLNSRIDVGKMAIMGHSMGGGGVLLAANEHSDQIQAAIPFTPWVPDVEFGNITVPTLVIAGSADRIANVTDHAWRHFESIPESTTKVYLEIEGGDHYVADSDRGTDLATVGRYGIAWLKLYLDGDERYRDFIYGAQHELDLDKFSRYLVGPDTNH